MDANHASKNPLYGKPLTYQAPRTVRFGLKFVF